MNEVLKPCPFCGEHRLADGEDGDGLRLVDGDQIRCDTCDAQTGYHAGPLRAVAAWNRREESRREILWKGKRESRWKGRHLGGLSAEELAEAKMFAWQRPHEAGEGAWDAICEEEMKRANDRPKEDDR